MSCIIFSTVLCPLRSGVKIRLLLRLFPVIHFLFVHAQNYTRNHETNTPVNHMLLIYVANMAYGVFIHIFLLIRTCLQNVVFAFILRSGCMYVIQLVSFWMSFTSLPLLLNPLAPFLFFLLL